MDAKSYSRVAAIIFAIIAILQLVRALSGWELTLNGGGHSAMGKLARIDWRARVCRAYRFLKTALVTAAIASAYARCEMVVARPSQKANSGIRPLAKPAPLTLRFSATLNLWRASLLIANAAPSPP